MLLPGSAPSKRRAATRDPKARYVHIADKLCERGWFGQKTGQGWYVYEAGTRGGKPNPAVEPIIAEERAKAGVTPRTFTREELERRAQDAKAIMEAAARYGVPVEMLYRPSGTQSVATPSAPVDKPASA